MVHAMFLAPPQRVLTAQYHLHGISKQSAMAHIRVTSAANTDRRSRKSHDENRSEEMFKKTAWASVILSLVAIPTLGAISFGAAPAEAAVVYCKTAGVPQGCVVRPVAPIVAPLGVARVGYGAAGVAHVGYTHVGPVTGLTHVGATRVRW
jgi:hypothetical protein